MNKIRPQTAINPNDSAEEYKVGRGRNTLSPEKDKLQLPNQDQLINLPLMARKIFF